MSRKLSKDPPWDKETVEAAVRDSHSYAGAIRLITGAPKKNGFQWSKLMRLIEEYAIDTSHFPNFAKRVSVGTRKRRPRASDGTVFANGTKFNREYRRRRYCEIETPDACRLCGISTWMGLPLVLQIDHISGDRGDWRLENLRWLCPNCHSQTPTYARGLGPTNAVELSMTTIKAMVDKSSYAAAARELGVSSEAVRRMMTIAGLDYGRAENLANQCECHDEIGVES